MIATFFPVFSWYDIIWLLVQCTSKDRGGDGCLLDLIVVLSSPLATLSSNLPSLKNWRRFH